VPNQVEGWIVTPRRGKPVEVQALWSNAVNLMGQWAEAAGESQERWLVMGKQSKDSFNHRFWYEPGSYLYDVIDGESGDDVSLRPNQVLTMSLRHPVLRKDRWTPVLSAVRDKLVTPFGLRSLAPGHHDYKSMYCGDMYFGDWRARDAAYHQGTVWAWLIGPYIDAWMKAGLDRAEAHRLPDGFRAHLSDDGIGTISEIFDAEQPYAPRGCIAQAWSVAEVLLAYQKTRQGRHGV
jgi:predicted glycogen debranching enzyme